MEATAVSSSQPPPTYSSIRPSTFSAEEKVIISEICAEISVDWLPIAKSGEKPFLLLLGGFQGSGKSTILEVVAKLHSGSNSRFFRWIRISRKLPMTNWICQFARNRTNKKIIEFDLRSEFRNHLFRLSFRRDRFPHYLQ